MSKTGKINQSQWDLDFPPVRITTYSLVQQFNQWGNSNRIAPFWRFYWNLTPGAQIVFAEGKIELTPDVVVLIPPNFSYASEASCKFSQLYMHFEWDTGFNIRTPFVRSSLDAMRQLADISQWFEADDCFFSLRMYSILYKYLADIVCEIRQTAKSDSRIIHAINLMNNNLNISNPEVAEALHMSNDNFQRLFKLETGSTPHQYRIARRMERAQAMLMETELTIEQIAVATGYTNRYQFSKAFMEFFKVAPVQYRGKIGRPKTPPTEL